MLFELLNSRLTVADADNPISFTLKVGGHGIADRLFIFDQQNLSCIRSHTRPPSSYVQNLTAHSSAHFVL